MTKIKKKHFENRIEKYKRFFINLEYEKLKLNDFMVIEDSIYKYKDQPKFEKVGEIIKILSNDTYTFIVGILIKKRHVTRFKRVNRDNIFLCEEDVLR
jgi:hypothetical protein